ncbi:hypothetical protein BH09VER1_BH09VER1_18290 [soil metagenome]
MSLVLEGHAPSCPLDRSAPKARTSCAPFRPQAKSKILNSQAAASQSPKPMTTNQPTDWESRYLANDTPWDKGAPHPALVQYLAATPLTGRILIPGCGLGNDVRALAQNPAAIPIGWDIAPSAVTAARALPPVGHEQYHLQDLFTPPADQLATFDAAFEDTCFCAINPSLRDQYVASVADLLRSSGTLVAIFFVNPDHDGDGPPYGCPLEELDRLFNKSFRLLHEQTNLPTFPGRENREVLRVLEKIS